MSDELLETKGVVSPTSVELSAKTAVELVSTTSNKNLDGANDSAVTLRLESSCKAGEDIAH